MLAIPKWCFASVCTLTLAVLGAAPASGRAEVYSFSSNVGLEALGAYSGTVAVTDVSATAATITFTLTNTSPTANGGYLTGFAFNAPAGVSLTGVTAGGWTYNGFDLLATNNGIPANPLGPFDLGGAVGGDWTGGGKPQDGIGVGDTGTFTFELTGTGLGGLTAASLFGATTDDGDWFATRFRGFANGGSDKVTAGGLTSGGGGTDPGTGGPNPVPAPAGLVLGAIAAVGFAIRRRLIG